MPHPTKLLTERERRFCVAFVNEAAGNASKAAILAGYSKTSARFQGSKLAAKRNIREQIATLRAAAESAAEERLTIADAKERREIVSAMARDPDAHPLARLKAVDIHNKMDGLYVQKHEVTGKLTLEQVLDASRGDGAAA